jgi:hypothetical protein
LVKLPASEWSIFDAAAFSNNFRAKSAVVAGFGAQIPQLTSHSAHANVPE